MAKKEKDRLGVFNLNLFIMLVAILLITIAYFIMGNGDYTISPIILIVAYAVVIPISLLIKPKKKDK
ncbi:MAG: hypothetical protein JXR56_01865 [Candidatus Cloacimonetes bacterium]|nr:hypothetical protein [Candidatus Cloacimonadota bacterium]